MNEQRIAVITDTGTDTPAEFAREHDVRIVPLRIIFSDGSTYESGVTITPEELVARLPKEIPTTSLPSPEVIKATFEKARADGYTSAVFVSISSGLSATCQTVRMVADELEDFPVTVVDTLSIGVAQLRVDESGVSLFARADAALYAAKRGGRNRVESDS